MRLFLKKASNPPLTRYASTHERNGTLARTSCLGAALIEFGLIYGTGAITFALVLAYVFPGYFSPFWPQHSDFYMPQAAAGNLSKTLSHLLGVRPIGFVFISLIGHLGVRGSIVAITALTIFNASFSVFIFRRVLALQFNLGFLTASALYFYVLFSSPFFYVFYAQDSMAQGSAALLLIGGGLFFLLNRNHIFAAASALFLFSTAAFLSKETYILSAFVFSALFFLLDRGTPLLRRSLPMVVICVAAAANFLDGIAVRSVFLGQAGGDAYRVDVSPASIAHEWWRYATGGLNALTLFSLVLLSVGWLVDKRGGAS